jgi:hypothetical protein
MNEKVVFVEFWKGRPHYVVTLRNDVPEIYYFDYSKKYDNMLFHAAGSGGKVPYEHDIGEQDRTLVYWADDSVVMKNDHNVKTRRMRKLREKVAWITDREKWNEYRPILPADEVEDTVYCKICEDFYDVDSLCCHVYWSQNDGWYAGAGSCDKEYSAYREAVLTFANKYGKEDLEKAIKAGKFEFYPVSNTFFGVSVIGFTLNGAEEILIREDDVADDSLLLEGVEWLRTIQFDGTDEARKQTIGFLR